MFWLTIFITSATKLNSPSSGGSIVVIDKHVHVGRNIKPMIKTRNRAGHINSPLTSKRVQLLIRTRTQIMQDSNIPKRWAGAVAVGAVLTDAWKVLVDVFVDQTGGGLGVVVGDGVAALGPADVGCGVVCAWDLSVDSCPPVVVFVCAFPGTSSVHVR